MYSFINIIQELIVNIREIMSGNTVRHNPDIDQHKKDIYNIEIPTFRDDRINLKKDRDVAARAYKKAADEKKLQLQV